MKPDASSNSSGTLSGRSIGIDALRGAAALTVVFYHAASVSGAFQSPGLVQAARSLLSGHNFPAFLENVGAFALRQGFLGVYLFFVISGFCIHMRAARGMARGGKLEVNAGSFWKARFRRLYPPYVFALALFLLADHWHGVRWSAMRLYDVALHLAMLHNLDHRTCYSIDPVFWTLAVEAQLYVGYFAFLWVRRRLDWTRTLAVCLAVRMVWLALSLVLQRKFGIDLAIKEAAPPHWFTWCLGALSVEAAVGLVKLPRWCRDWRLGVALLIMAAELNHTQDAMDPHGLVGRLWWLFSHPFWGLGCFVMVNSAVAAEQARDKTRKFGVATLAIAEVGVFSYSLYLTHMLLLTQVGIWMAGQPQVAADSVRLLLFPILAIGFAWICFRLCELPFMTPPKPAQPAPAT